MVTERVLCKSLKANRRRLGACCRWCLKSPRRYTRDERRKANRRMAGSFHRHTTLTRLGEHCDVFTLATIAGHSSITMAQRYVHPQADAIERAFARWVGTKLGTTRNGGIIPCPKISRNSFSYKEIEW